jgi:hypothetical protein
MGLNRLQSESPPAAVPVLPLLDVLRGKRGATDCQCGATRSGVRRLRLEVNPRCRPFSPSLVGHFLHSPKISMPAQAAVRIPTARSAGTRRV